nr:MAG TPA: hypothetical protein [Caudoviricetes sp.]
MAPAPGAPQSGLSTTTNSQSTKSMALPTPLPTLSSLAPPCDSAATKA